MKTRWTIGARNVTLWFFSVITLCSQLGSKKSDSCNRCVLRLKFPKWMSFFFPFFFKWGKWLLSAYPPNLHQEKKQKRECVRVLYSFVKRSVKCNLKRGRREALKNSHQLIILIDLGTGGMAHHAGWHKEATTVGRKQKTESRGELGL